ncbi:MAG: redoxin family protein [gamma proteobacterium symbiont of Bathyaustriella thionipta]|nr:redoxin family protein [gamma proteobacterium symbiont of Bathyaustriella thionipta]
MTNKILLKNTFWLLSGALLSVGLLLSANSSGHVYSTPGAMPEFTHHDPQSWIGSKPLKLAELRGKVVFIDFWTFDCWNCYRSFPWLNELQKGLEGQHFVVIGVHTPEFAHEKIRVNVEEKMAEFKLHHPVMMDNDFSYWKAVGNRYWPAFYLLDKKGCLRAHYVGEIHAGDRQAEAIEAKIAELL